MNGNYISIQPKYEVYRNLFDKYSTCMFGMWRLKYEYNLYHMLLYNLFNKI